MRFNNRDQSADEHARSAHWSVVTAEWRPLRDARAVLGYPKSKTTVIVRNLRTNVAGFGDRSFPRVLNSSRTRRCRTRFFVSHARLPARTLSALVRSGPARAASRPSAGGAFPAFPRLPTRASALSPRSGFSSPPARAQAGMAQGRSGTHAPGFQMFNLNANLGPERQLYNRQGHPFFRRLARAMCDLAIWVV